MKKLSIVLALVCLIMAPVGLTGCHRNYMERRIDIEVPTATTVPIEIERAPVVTPIFPALRPQRENERERIRKEWQRRGRKHKYKLMADIPGYDDGYIPAFLINDVCVPIDVKITIEED